MKTILITGLLLIALADIFAQKVWSYQDCILYALENNLNLNTYSFDEERQRLNYNAAKNNFLPSLSASTGYEIREGRSLDPETNLYTENKNFQNSYGIRTNLLVFNGFRQQNLLAYERYRLTAARETYEQQKNDIAFLIVDAYVTHLSNSGLVGIQEEQVELSRQEVHRITKRIELGLSSGSDLYETEARYALEEYLLVQYQNQSNKSKNDLKRLMNLSLDESLVLRDVSDDGEELFHYSADSLINIAEGNLPEVKSMIAQLEASRKLVGAARSALTPSLVAFGAWGTSYFGAYDTEIRTFNDQFTNNRQFNYGLSLNIPLVDAFRRRNYLQQTKVDMEQAKNNVKVVLQTIEYQINQAVLDWHGSMAEYHSAQKSESSMKLAFEVAEKRREKGLISIMEFYEAKNNLSTAKAEVLRTGLQLFMRERTINFYLTGSLTD